MNHLENIAKLNNEYFILRHGQSRANLEGIVVSHLNNGILEEYTLTMDGENQVRKSTKKAKDDGLLGSDTIIYASTFSRARRSAEIAKEVLGVEDEINFDERLIERNFGDWEKTDSTAYPKVWDVDIKDPHHKEFNVESTQEVLKRMTSVIKDLEEKYSGKKILIVSHGDPLQILETGFRKISSSLHRSVEPLKTAEIRSMNLAK